MVFLPRPTEQPYALADLARLECRRAIRQITFIIASCVLVIVVTATISVQRMRHRMVVATSTKTLSSSFLAGDVFQMSRILESLLSAEDFSHLAIRDLASGRVVAHASNQEDQKANFFSRFINALNIQITKRHFLYDASGQKVGVFEVSQAIRGVPYLMVTVVIVLIVLLISRLLYRRMLRLTSALSNPLTRFAEIVAETHNSQDLQRWHWPDLKIQELILFRDQMKALSTRLVNAERVAAEGVHNRNMIELARSVSHDIRSPLANLNVLMSASDMPDADRRLAVRACVSRIKEIANDLLRKSKGVEEIGTTKDVASVGDLVTEIVDEKKNEYLGRKYLTISLAKDSTLDHVRVLASAMLLKRILSNLINNAVESMNPQDEGNVLIDLRRSGEDGVVICIKDNGSGIPDEIKAQLGKRPLSFGKGGDQSGAGIALFNAKKEIESWRGNLSIESEMGRGTTIVLNLTVSSFMPEYLHQ